MRSVEEWRGKLIEALAEVDETLLDRYVEDHESITPDEILTALRKSNNRRNCSSRTLRCSIQE